MIIYFIIEDLLILYLQKFFHSPKEARKAIGSYIHTYNFVRHHSAINNETPASNYYPALLLDYAA